MAEYIEREVAKNAFPKAEADAFENCRYCTCLDSEQIGEILDNIPAADVVPVVRCKDCEYAQVQYSGNVCQCELDGAIYDNEYYCACGSKKDGDGE